MTRETVQASGTEKKMCVWCLGEAEEKEGRTQKAWI